MAWNFLNKLINRNKKEAGRTKVEWDAKFTVKHRDYDFAVYEIQSEEGKGYKVSWNFLAEDYERQHTGHTYYSVATVHDLIEKGIWIVQ